MKYNKLFIWIGLLIVLCSSMTISTYAVPPVTTLGNQLSSGIIISTSKIEYVTINSNYTFMLHLFNLSNGVPLHTKPSCYIDIYNPTGKEIASTSVFTKEVDTNDYSILIQKANQTMFGLYSYIAWCNSTAYAIGGVVSGAYTVVRDTQLYRLTDNHPYYAITLIGFMFAIAFFLLYFSNQFKLEGEPWGITLTKLSASLLLKLMSLGTIIYSIFIIKLILPEITNVTNVFDNYMSMFIWGIIIFFIIYFVHQFVVMAINFNVAKEQKGKRLAE